MLFKRPKIVVLLVAVPALVAGMLVSAANANALAPVVFVDGGTSGPPTTLGGYAMTPFGADPQPAGGSLVTAAPGPTGNVTFGGTVAHYKATELLGGWGNGYTGDTYFPASQSITLTLPANTHAFYFYGIGNAPGTYNVTATSDSGTSSGPIAVTTNLVSNQANNFGFYTTADNSITSITATTDNPDGILVGEFGIAAAPPAAPVPNNAPASDGLISGVNIITPQGSTVNWTASGYAPGAPVEFVLYNAQTYKEQTALATVTADSSGTATYTGPVPHTTGIKYVAAIGYKTNGKVLDLTGQTRFM